MWGHTGKLGAGAQSARSNMLRMPRIATVLWLLAASGALCVCATSSVVAKHRSHHHHRSHKSHESSEPTREKAVTAVPRTPVDTNDCVAVSQSFYGRAKSVFRHTKQGIPRDFERVVANLDEFCGEEEFEKARVSIDWMNTCLQNYTKEDKQGSCSQNRSYFCAIDPRSDGCTAASASDR